MAGPRPVGQAGLLRASDAASSPAPRVAAFTAFSKEFPVERAVASAKKSVRMPDTDWLDPELAEEILMCVELNPAGQLADDC